MGTIKKTKTKTKTKDIDRHSLIQVALDQFEECLKDPNHENNEKSIALMQYSIRESIYGNPHTFWVLEAILEKNPNLDQWCILLNTEDTAWMFRRPESHCKEIVQRINTSFAIAFKHAPLDVLQNVSEEHHHCLTWLLYTKKYGYDTEIYQAKIKDILANDDPTISQEDLQWFVALVLNVDVPEAHKQKQLDSMIEAFNLTYSPVKKVATNRMLKAFVNDNNPHHYHWNEILVQSDRMFEALRVADDHNRVLKEAVSVRKDQWSEWIVQLCRKKSFDHANVEHVEIALRAMDALEVNSNKNTLLTSILRQWIGSPSFSILDKHLQIYKSIDPAVRYHEVARNTLEPVGTLVELPIMSQ